MIGFASLCVTACVGLLIAERFNSRIGIWLFKTTAATSYLGAAIVWGALESSYGAGVFIALCLCWLGDVLLIPENRPNCFLLGIGAFFLGHVAFAVAFARLGISITTLTALTVLTTIAGRRILRWLRPHLSGLFVRAVPAYVIAIGAMLTLACSAGFAAGSGAVAFGALLFAVSDLSVARNRFIEPKFANSAWGLPAYFAAQLILASTTADRAAEVLSTALVN